MISINNLSIELGKKPILNNINVLLDNSTYGVLGPNGAGKTTLFRCICGLYSNYSGEINYNYQCDNCKRIGYLPQNFNMFSELSIKDNMHYFASLKGIKRKNEEIGRTIDFVHLSDEINKKAYQLSGGMKRRVGIAQALLGNPSIILLDEPTVGLDPEEREKFVELIRRINNDDKTVLLSTHILNDVDDCCNKVIILKNGEIIFSGDTIQLKQTHSDDNANYSASIQEGYLCFMKEI